MPIIPSILCRFGAHDWQTVKVDGDYDCQECSRCKERRVRPNKSNPGPASYVVNTWVNSLYQDDSK
jgi:hypothetical protein